MNLKIQKIIMFIPIVNIVTYFCWLSLASKSLIPLSKRIITILKMFLGIFIITLLRLPIMLTCENEIVNNIALAISLYLYFFVMAYVAVDAQKKIIFSNQQ